MPVALDLAIPLMKKHISDNCVCAHYSIIYVNLCLIALL